MHYTFHHNSWYGGKPVEIDIPDSWDVTECKMPADDMSELTKEALRERINSPYGTVPIRELAKGKKDVCIMFDDMSRGTPCELIAHIILEELSAAGVRKDQVRFICALGSHGTCTREDFAKKLGADIVKEYAVFNHSPFQNCSFVGKTSSGIPLYINDEVMHCDLKIGIGSISPHPVNGFGGGGKLMMVGCGGIETIDQLHKASMRSVMEKKLSFQACVGGFALDGMRREIEEAVAITGFDFKVDAILNSDCKIVACTAGDPIDEYYAGAQISSRVNHSKQLPKDMDIVIANANVKANEASIAFVIAAQLLKRQGGAIVMVSHIPSGQVFHQYAGAAGYYIGGKAFGGIKDRIPFVKRTIHYTPYPDLQSAISFGDHRRILFAETWEEAMLYLADYPAGSKVALLSDATIMSFS